MNKGTKIKKLRKSGFRARMKTSSGKRIINAKRSKQRNKISF